MRRAARRGFGAFTPDSGGRTKINFTLSGIYGTVVLSGWNDGRTEAMTTATDYLAAVNQPGAFQAVAWESQVKPAAAHKGRTLVKVTRATVRTGVDYANLAVNEGTDTGSLPWGEWETFPYVIRHRGSLYARLYIVDGTVRTRYYVDGEEVTREAFGEYLTPSQRKPRKSNGGTVTPKLDSVTLL